MPLSSGARLGAYEILDFGLAKVVSPEDSGFLSQSPTLSSSPTMAGIVMGIAAYMGPGQGRGDPVDRRTDIWAFGCLLFEAVTGRRAFPGRTTSDTIATVLREDPDWSRAAAVAPLKPQLLIRRCPEEPPCEAARHRGRPHRDRRHRARAAGGQSIPPSAR
jgi:serine/threonine protein kinase